MPVFSRFMAGNGGKRGFVFTALLAILAALAMGGCRDEVTRTVYYDVSVPQGIRIETAEQLANIGLVEEYPAGGEYYLGNDIDLSVLYEKGEDRFELLPGTPYVWRSIGSTCRECGGPLVPSRSSSTDYHILPLLCKNMECSLYDERQPPFSGTLHGNGKTISGLKLTGGTKNEAAKDGGATEGYAGAYCIGLFGYLNNAYIHDLTLEVANTAEDPRIAYNGTSGRPSVGTLAAVARSSRITDITLRAAEGSALYVTAALTSANTYNYIGGAVGFGYMTNLTNITSSLPLDVDGPGSQYVGGIAGYLSGEIRDSEVTGAITVNNETNTDSRSEVAGICTGYITGTGIYLTVRNCTVTMDELILNVASSGGNNWSAYLSGIGGGSMIADCSVNISRIKLYSEDTVARTLYVGGISASVTADIERCHARFDSMEVTGTASAQYGISYIGGLVGNFGTTKNMIDNYVAGGGTVTVDLPYAAAANLYVGGLVGQGSVSHSNIAGGITIDVTTGTTDIVYAGGLTGNGVAEYSFIGSPDKHAKLKVTKTNTTTAANGINRAAIGGISGQAPLTATRPFRYNYAFCDVTLVTQSASKTTAPNQAIGGLAGYVTYTTSNSLFTESYAAGSVTVTDNYTGSTDAATELFAGGIAGYGTNNALLIIAKCAALNGSITINGEGTNTDGKKTWRHIMYPAATTAATSFANNITTITNVPNVNSNAPGDPGPNTADGLLVDAVTEDTFFETLGWSRDVWEWDAASGYPVLK